MDETLNQNYQVTLPDFHGPLDLLLSLIQDQELDITKISLGKVTHQYLAHLDILKAFNPSDLTDFLVIAARLVLIKSEILLPQPPKSLAHDDEEEDVGEALARQLRLYKQFKTLAEQLREMETQEQHNFVRTAPPPKIDVKPDTLKIEVDALLKAARRALAVTPLDPNVDDVVSRDSLTIGQQMAHIRDRLAHHESLLLQNLLQPHHNRVDVIVTLLAVLELIKRQVIQVQQPTLFGEIVIRQSDIPSRLTEADWVELTGQQELS